MAKVKDLCSMEPCECSVLWKSTLSQDNGIKTGSILSHRMGMGFVLREVSAPLAGEAERWSVEVWRLTLLKKTTRGGAEECGITRRIEDDLMTAHDRSWWDYWCIKVAPVRHSRASGKSRQPMYTPVGLVVSCADCSPTSHSREQLPSHKKIVITNPDDFYAFKRVVREGGVAHNSRALHSS